MEIKQRSRLSWIAVLLLVAVFTGGSFLLARLLVGNRSTVLTRAALLPCTPDQNIQPLGNGLVYYDGNLLRRLNGSLEQSWSCMVGSGADYEAGENGVAAWNGTMLTLLDASSGASLYSGNMEQSILSARMGPTYAAVLTGEEQNSTMIVMDRSGAQVDAISFENVTVMDYGFFSDGAMLWVMTLDTEGTTPMSSISTYRPGRSLAGTITDAEQVVYHVLFEDAQIRAVGTTYIKTYDYTGPEITSDRQLVYGWYMVDVGEGENPLMCFVPTGQADGSLSVNDVRLIRSSSERRIRMPFACTDLLIKGSTLYGFSGQYAMICGPEAEKPTVYTLPLTTDRVIGLTDNQSAIIVSGDQVYLVPLN